MTSNLASEEIANYAQDLRREQEKKSSGSANSNSLTSEMIFFNLFKLSLIFIWIRVLDENSPNQDDDRRNKIAVSKQFKDKVVKPILKVLISCSNVKKSKSWKSCFSLKRHFRRDEFLGRINEMVYFLPFSKSEINKLVSKQLEFWQKRVKCSVKIISYDKHFYAFFFQAKQQHNIDLDWDRKALECLAEGYDINYGARSLIHEVKIIFRWINLWNLFFCV